MPQRCHGCSWTLTFAFAIVISTCLRVKVAREMSRVFLGNLPSDCRVEDIEDFFSSSLNPSKGLSVAGQAIQEDIRKCLTKALKVPSTSTSSEARKQDLLIQSLMGTILKDSKSTSKPPGPLQAPLYTWQPPMAPITIPGMLFSDSDSAPNYTHLNYKENITRY